MCWSLLVQGILQSLDHHLKSGYIWMVHLLENSTSPVLPAPAYLNPGWDQMVGAPSTSKVGSSPSQEGCHVLTHLPWVVDSLICVFWDIAINTACTCDPWPTTVSVTGVVLWSFHRTLYTLESNFVHSKPSKSVACSDEIFWTTPGSLFLKSTWSHGITQQLICKVPSKWRVGKRCQRKRQLAPRRGKSPGNVRKSQCYGDILG